MKLKVLRFLDIAIEFSIYGIIFYIPISIALVGTFAGIAIVLFLFKKILSPDFSSIKANKMFFLYLLFFFVFMDLSLLNSGPLVAKSLKALLIKWGRYPLLLWAIVDTFRDTRRIVKAACVLLFSATLVGLTVFTQKFFGWEFLRGRMLGNVTGPFKNPNDLAAYLTCVIPIVLSLTLWQWKRIAIKICLFCITVMLLVSSFWTLSRGGWLGLIASGIFLYLVFKRFRMNSLILNVYLAGLFFLSVMMRSRLLYIFQPGGDAQRFAIWPIARRMIKENPFLGKGLGTFMDYCSQYGNGLGTYYAHNCFLQIWAESGVFSLLSFLLFVGYVFYRSMKVSLRIPRSLNYFILIGLTAGLLGFLVHSFFDTQLYSFQLSFLFWVVLGLTVAVMRLELDVSK